MSSPFPIVLGSTSPRRLELIQMLFPSRDISVMPPLNSEERDLSHCTDQKKIMDGLLQIAGDKSEDVCEQRRQSNSADAIVLAADTGVLVESSPGSFQLLGKPDPENYRDEVREWFERYYLGKTHSVVTAVCLSFSGPSAKPEQRCSCLVTSKVTMASDLQNRIQWYLDTKEPLGKAGGYAIQGAGSLFIEKVTGSISNIIGLPLKETLQLFETADSLFASK